MKKQVHKNKIRPISVLLYSISALAISSILFYTSLGEQIHSLLTSVLSQTEEDTKGNNGNNDQAQNTSNSQNHDTIPTLESTPSIETLYEPSANEQNNKTKLVDDHKNSQKHQEEVNSEPDLAPPTPVSSLSTFNSESTGSSSGGGMYMFNQTISNPISTCKYTLTSKIPFIDIKNHWAKKYVSSLYRQCIISGKDDKHFAPNKTITRAELLKIAVSAFKLDKLPYINGSFKDVSSKDWFAEYLTSAYKSQIIEAYYINSQLYFKPDQTMTQAEALKVLLLAAKADLRPYLNSQKEHWYEPYASFASSKKIIDIKDFSPNQAITRAEVAKMTYLIQNPLQ